MSEDETKEKCIICGGGLLKDFVEEFFPPEIGLEVISSIYELNLQEIQRGYYCEKCGIKYKNLPKEV